MTPAAGGAGVEVFAQGRGGVDQLVGGAIAAAAAAERSRVRWSWRPRLPGGRGRQGHARRSSPPRGGPGRPPRRARPGRRSASALSATEIPFDCEPNSFWSASLTALRLAARDVEAAAGEVVGLVRGEGQGERRRSPPRPPPPSAGAGRETPASRFIPSRIGWLASLSHRRRPVCASRHSRRLFGDGREATRDQQVPAPRRRRRQARLLSRSGSERACRAKPSPTANR